MKMELQALNNMALEGRLASEATGRGEAKAERVGLFASAFTAKLDERLDETARELDTAAVRAERQSEQVREAAEQLVASAFVLPFLQQARDSSLGSDLFHGGQAEKAFGQQLDTHLADRFVQGGNFPLVDAVEQYMMRRGGRSAAMTGREVNIHG